LPNNPSTFQIGALDTTLHGGDYNAEYFNGGIDEVAYYSSALTAAQVQQHYKAATQLLDIVPTSLTWDTAQGGVNFAYKVAEADLTQDTTMALYWAKGPTLADALEPVDQPVYFQTIPAGTAVGTYGPFHVAPGSLHGAPVGASYLLVVTDPVNSIVESDESNNLVALRDIAAQLRDSGRIAFANSHVSGIHDSATALQNILDAANGYLAQRSSYGNAPGGGPGRRGHAHHVHIAWPRI
jgi:hypothetical protein